MNRAFWRGRSVLVTGHTGFKGGWLALWLHAMGAKVSGFALPPPTSPNLFEEAGVEGVMERHVLGDIRDGAAVARAVAEAQPEIVLHLAAQPLVRLSYAEPVETYATNVVGTANVLEAARRSDSVRTVVSVTTDKCYENKEWVWPYREYEPLGGHDPYSSSKACAELVTSAYRSSFYEAAGKGLASARAGNVIGGGDWAADRLIPDFFRALDAGTPILVRYPDAIRPWQHVMEPLAGYLRLAELLHGDARGFGEGWNFGPGENDARPVRWILDHLCGTHPGMSWTRVGEPQPHEAGFLRLDSSKAKARLGWAARLDLAEALDLTAAWHAAWREGRDMRAFTAAQIEAYTTRA